jgi:hypothetical protein
VRTALRAAAPQLRPVRNPRPPANDAVPARSPAANAKSTADSVPAPVPQKAWSASKPPSQSVPARCGSGGARNVDAHSHLLGSAWARKEKAQLREGDRNQARARLRGGARSPRARASKGRCNPKTSLSRAGSTHREKNWADVAERFQRGGRRAPASVVG